MSTSNRIRLAIIVSHPIQYYVPLYRLLARRADVQIKVFFTWHGGQRPVQDHGFKTQFQWDIPLTDGYDSEVIPNTAPSPGTHHFLGLRNPTLVSRVLAWQPDAVHITGYAWFSHLLAIRGMSRRRIPVLFRGDSHLLNQSRRGLPWGIKRILLRRVFHWPAAFLYVGQANRDYYEAFGVPASRLHYCPHSIEVDRFAEPASELEAQARTWRQELGIPEDRVVLLFAGKFEDKKRPTELMQAVQRQADPRLLLVMVGDGELGNDVRRLAAADPDRFRVLPFQNQSRMPLVYRLGDLFILPSAYGETWGLAVNEAFACGRPALVSDRVGCARDMIDPGVNGDIFETGNWSHFRLKLGELAANQEHLRQMGVSARKTADQCGISDTEASLVRAMTAIV